VTSPLNLKKEYQQFNVKQGLSIDTTFTQVSFRWVVLWATKKVTFIENWLLFLIGQYFMYVLGNEK
jgi:hypothetical protein